LGARVQIGDAAFTELHGARLTRAGAVRLAEDAAILEIDAAGDETDGHRRGKACELEDVATAGNLVALGTAFSRRRNERALRRSGQARNELEHADGTAIVHLVLFTREDPRGEVVALGNSESVRGISHATGPIVGPIAHVRWSRVVRRHARPPVPHSSPTQSMPCAASRWRQCVRARVKRCSTAPTVMCSLSAISWRGICVT